jgi:hypothetical protein
MAISAPARANAVNATFAADAPNRMDRWRAKDILDNGNMMYLRRKGNRWARPVVAPVGRRIVADTGAFLRR